VSEGRTVLAFWDYTSRLQDGDFAGSLPDGKSNDGARVLTESRFEAFEEGGAESFSRRLSAVRQFFKRVDQREVTAR